MKITLLVLIKIKVFLRIETKFSLSYSLFTSCIYLFHSWNKPFIQSVSALRKFDATSSTILFLSTGITRHPEHTMQDEPIPEILLYAI